MTESLWNATGSAYPTRPDADHLVGSVVPDSFVVLGTSFLGKYDLGNWILTHTGGDAVRLMVIACEGGSGSAVRATRPPVETVEQPALEPSEALAFIQSTFGLSVTALAQVLRVERPTIYSWLRSSNVPTSANQERIAKIVRLAEHWSSLSGGAALQDLRAEVLSGKSLFDLLSEEHLRTFSAETAMRELWKRSSARPAHRSTLREIARSRGISRDSTEFDVVTGRRFGEED